MELNQTRDMKGNKDIYKHSSSESKIRQNTSPLLNEAEHLIKDMEKAEVLNAFFTLACTSKINIQ